jgi:RHS repeat-associated protein
MRRETLTAEAKVCGEISVRRSRDSLKLAALAVLALSSAPLHLVKAQGGGALHYDPTPQILADMARKGYTETVEDLSVKVLGGHVTFRRTLVGSAWYFNRHWDAVRAGVSCTGKSVMRGEYEYFFAGTETVPFNGADHQADIYRYLSDKRIVGIQDPNQPPPVILSAPPGGGGGGGGVALACTNQPIRYLQLRWEDSFGNWIEYDGVNGRALRYGDRNEVAVSFSYNANGNLDGVYDHFDARVLSFQYQTFAPQNIERLVAVSDTTNRSVQYFWSSNGNRLDRVVDVRGNQWSYQYNTSNILEKIVDPEGRQKIITIGRTGGVESVVMAEPGATDGVGMTYSYDYDPAKIEFTAIRRATGGREESVTYDKNGYIVRQDANGTTLYTVEIEPGARKRTRTEHSGNQTITEFDERGNLIKQTFADSTFKEVTYNKYSLPLRFVDENGTVTLNEYDARGNVVRITEAVGTAAERVTEYGYDQYGQMTLMRSVGDARTATAELAYTYDDVGNVETVTDPEGGVTSYTYDVMGNVLTQIDRRGKLWSATYDASGNVLTVTDPLDHVVTFIYDRVGNLTRAIDPAEFETEYQYDARDNVLEVTDQLGGVFTSVFDDNDYLIGNVDESGHVETLEFDFAGRPLRQVDGASNTTAFGYQDKNVSSNGFYFQTNRISHPTFDRVLQYDRRERLIQDTVLLDGSNPLVTDFQYDRTGLAIRQTDPNGASTDLNRDALGRVISVSDASGATAFAEFDDRDNLVSVTDHLGNVNRLEYDRNDRVVAKILPLGQRTEYAYDRSGNLTSVIDPLDRKITYAYDDADRLVATQEFATSADTTPAKTVTYAYEARDLLTAWDDGQASGTLVYDELARLTSETVDFGPFSLTYSMTYNANGTVDTFTDADGSTYRYLYDGANKPMGLVIPSVGMIAVNSFEWYAPTKITLPGGTTREYEHTGLLQPATITVKDPGLNVVSQFAMTYDGVRNVLTKESEFGTSTYLYDGVYRLTNAANSQQGDQSYDLDAIGNRIRQNAAPDTWQYDDNNRLLSTGTITYSYDDNGNLRERDEGGSITRYVYDIGNRLIRVETGSGAIIAAYGYDPFDRRLWKDTGGTRTYFLYSDAGLIGEYTSAGTQTRAYGYMPGSEWTTEPVYLKSGSAYHFYHNDQIGAPYKLTDISGNVSWSAYLDPFGNANILQDDIENNLRFPGQYFDAETGLSYNWHRYYDASIGRYITADPIGLEAGVNFYAYANANPLNLIDPYGLNVGAPGFGESLIPVWGSGREAINDFQCGRWGWGLFNTGMAVLDVFGAGTLIKAGWKTGSHTWRMTRRWLGNRGFAEPGQHVHHAIVPQAAFGRSTEWLFNQPWNLKPLTPPPGIDPGRWHMMVEGRTPGLDGLQRWWHGTPDWLKAEEGSYAGKMANVPRGDCDCE